jgi:hypothetical protein
VAQHVSVALETPQTYGLPMTKTSRIWVRVFQHRERHPRLGRLKAFAAVWAAALIVGSGALIPTAPPSRAAHPDGVRDLANNARTAGASEAEITEAVEVGYLYGGTAALVMGANAFRSS